MTRDTEIAPGIRTLDELQAGVLDLVAHQLDFPRNKLSLQTRLIEDLNCDSLELVELMMAIETAFSVTISDRAPNEVYKSVFTRQPFRLADLAELVYLQQHLKTPNRCDWTGPLETAPTSSSAPFAQLGGRLESVVSSETLYEPLDAGADGQRQFRRRTDGMRCVLLPAAVVEIGDDGELSAQRGAMGIRRARADFAKVSLGRRRTDASTFAKRSASGRKSLRRRRIAHGLRQ